MAQKTKITEIRETYTHKKRTRKDDGSYEIREVTSTRYKEVNYVEGWPRFGGFIIDVICILLFETAAGAGIGLIIVFLERTNLIGTHEMNVFLSVITWLIIRPMFYVLFESTAQATPAKLILRRVVVNEYGEKPSFKQVLGRAYGRIVPFEFFSCLGTLGWHDTWTNTFVIRKVDLEDLKLAIKIRNFDMPENEQDGASKEP